MRQVGPYKIVRVVGRGGLGVVYQAVGPKGKPVALKLLHAPQADSVAARRMAREFEELRAVEHRNIVRVLDAGVSEETPYLVMEFVDGVPLRRFLDTFDDDPGYSAHPPPVPVEDSISLDQNEASTITEGSVADRFLSWLSGNEEPDSLDARPRSKSGSPSKLLSAEIRAELKQRKAG